MKLIYLLVMLASCTNTITNGVLTGGVVKEVVKTEKGCLCLVRGYYDNQKGHDNLRIKCPEATKVNDSVLFKVRAIH